MAKKRVQKIHFASKWPEHYGPEDVAVIALQPNGKYKLEFEGSRGGTTYGLTAKQVLAEIKRRRGRRKKTSPGFTFARVR